MFLTRAGIEKGQIPDRGMRAEWLSWLDWSVGRSVGWEICAFSVAILVSHSSVD